MGSREIRDAYINMAEGLPWAFLDLNGRGKVVYINKRAESLLGRGKGAIGMKLAEVVSRRHLFQLLSIFSEAVREGSVTGEIEIKSVEGGKTVGLRVVAVKAGGSVTGFQCHLRRCGLKEFNEGNKVFTALASARIAMNKLSR
jgi:PAS domain-containing protein